MIFRRHWRGRNTQYTPRLCRGMESVLSSSSFSVLSHCNQIKIMPFIQTSSAFWRCKAEGYNDVCVQYVLFLFLSFKQAATTFLGRSFTSYVHAFPFLVLTRSIPSFVITQTPDNQRSFILCLYSPSCKACLCHSVSSNEKASCNESTLTEMGNSIKKLVF